MEDEGFGAYNFYFDLCRITGSFPLTVEDAGQKLKACTKGIFTWWYYLNFMIITFSLAFQICQSFLILAYGTNLDGHMSSGNIVGQFVWIFFTILPFGNYWLGMTKENHIAEVLDHWCHLEQNIVGSTFRGLSLGKSGPTPTMSSCHLAQKNRFNKISALYIFLGLLGALTVGLHCKTVPRFPTYLYCLAEADDIWMLRLSVAFQIWVAAIIWSHIYMIEVLYITMSSSMGHIMETISYRGGVVMTRWVCDLHRVDDLIINHWHTMQFQQDEKHLQPETKNLPNQDKNNNPSKEDHMTLKESEGGNKIALIDQQNGDTTQIAKIVQNLVDIEYALESYMRVISVVDDVNHSVGMLIAHHQFVYLIMFVLMTWNAIRNFGDLDGGAILIYIFIIAIYIVRMFLYYPAMGNLDRQSDCFIDSWMEGLRYIPRGKYAYEFYWYKIQSCRLLHYWCGHFYTMERSSVLEFFHKVSELTIVLLQLY